MDLALADKSVLVTGASRGIGAAVVEAFASEGASPIHAAARLPESLDELVDRISRQHGATVIPHALNVGDGAARQQLVAEVGDVDILVNNAGAIPPGPFAQVTEQIWRESWELKVWGYIELCREYYGRMTRRSSGVIVNNIGLGGERPHADYIAGSTGNAAVIALTRALGGSSLDQGVRVVGVNTGVVLTDRLQATLRKRAVERFGDEGQWRTLLENYPAGRAATPEEVAWTIVFLASDRSSYTTGHVVALDGGVSWRNLPF